MPRLCADCLINRAERVALALDGRCPRCGAAHETPPPTPPGRAAPERDTYPPRRREDA